MPSNERIRRLSAAITESREIDWGQEQSAARPEETLLVRKLALIAKVAEANRKATQEDDSLPFTTWGHLRVLSRIGSGAYGDVFRAWDENLQQDVALKLFHPAPSGEDDAFRRNQLLEEARNLAKVKHENVVRVFGADVHHGRVGFWMEYVSGKTLEGVLTETGTMDAVEATNVAVKVCRGLATVHSTGILHRDIKAANVVREDGGRIYLLDFGSGEMQTAGETRKTAGTPLYMAPEAILEGRASKKSDVYSVGVLLFYLVTKRFPYEAKALKGLQEAHAGGRSNDLGELRPGLPIEFRRLVARCLDPAPDKRYTASELEDALSRSLGVTAPSSRRGRTWNLVLAGLLLALVATQIPWDWFQRESAPQVLSEPLVSVAVLPLQSHSPRSPHSEYVGSGLESRMTTQLSRVAGLGVRPWLRSRQFGDFSQPLSTVAANLSVQYLILGTYREEEDKLLVSVSLVDAATETQVWAADFEEAWTNVQRLEQQLVLSVARHLKQELTPREEALLTQVATHEPLAYDEYLKGAHALQMIGQLGSTQVEKHFKRAVEYDPNFADAWVGLGAVYEDQYFRGFEGETVLRDAEVSFQRGLELDPTSGSARRGLILVQWERGQMEPLLKLAQEARAAGLEGNDLLMTRGQAYVLGGIPEKAVPLLEALVDQDPGDEGALWWLVIANAWSGRYEETIRTATDYLSRFGSEPEMHNWRGVARSFTGRFSEAMEDFDEAIRLGADNMYVYVHAGVAASMAGETRTARRLWSLGARLIEKQLETTPDNARVAGFLAYLYAHLGQADKLEDSIERSRRTWPSNGLLLSQLGFASVVMGDSIRALELVSASVALGTAYPLAMHAAMGGELPEDGAYARIKKLVEAQRAELARRF